MSVPAVSALTPSPLRNRLRVEFDAPVATVWSLLGDLSRFPEYSAGLARVDPVFGADGRCTEYVCHFRPMPGDDAGIVHREIVRWYEVNRGYASTAEPNNAFGMVDDLNLTTLDATPRGTLVTWDTYFGASDIAMVQTSYDDAFRDMAARLIERFGGRVIERFARDLREPVGADVCVAHFTDAMHRGDLDAAVARYAADAVLVAQPGARASGHAAIREALGQFAALRPTLVSTASHVLDQGDVALYLGRWSLTGVAPDGAVVTMSGKSTDVLRREGAEWVIAIDNPWGTAVVG